jgi:deoxyribonuclease-4
MPQDDRSPAAGDMQPGPTNLGAHVPSADPLAEAAARGADAVQFFLSDPQGWRKPKPRSDAATLREVAFPVYVHAPYLVNVASPNNRIRIPSRRILQETCDAAAQIGATAVIVHGGHTDDDTAPAEGFRNWRKALQQLESDVAVYIENTAGGDNAMARGFDQLARLWEALDGLPVGFCLDTCHAHAAGEHLHGAVERLRSTIGRIDLLHVNDSKDPLGSGRDRHAALGQGTIEPDALLEVVRTAGAPVIVETPGDAAGQREELQWLRTALAGEAAGRPTR